MQFSRTDLQQFNTLKLASFAQLAYLNDTSQLKQLLAIDKSLFFLGGGSNIVLHDKVDRQVVKVELKGRGLVRETDRHYIVEAYGGENWHDFVAYCLDNSWYGLENLALIPGTVGAAPVQNIGAYGVELEQLLESVTALNLLDGKIHVLSKTDCNFSYRDSLFKHAAIGEWLIIKVSFRLTKNWCPNVSYPDLQKHDLLLGNSINSVTAKQIFKAVCDIRANKLPDPELLPNAGSFFKNPIIKKDFLKLLLQKYPELKYFEIDSSQVKVAAGWLIDNAGWRGKRLGPVGMHSKQALVLVNYEKAAASDVMRLAAAIKTDIKNRFGISLEQEPLLIT